MPSRFAKGAAKGRKMTPRKRGCKVRPSRRTEAIDTGNNRDGALFFGVFNQTDVFIQTMRPIVGKQIILLLGMKPHLHPTRFGFDFFFKQGLQHYGTCTRLFPTTVLFGRAG